MPRLVACPHCSVHVKLAEPRCPGCGAALPVDASRIGLTAGAVLLGLSLAACTSSEPPPKPKTPPADVKKDDAKVPDPPIHEPEAEYGVPVYDNPAPAYGMAEPLPEEPPPEPEPKGKRKSKSKSK